MHELSLMGSLFKILEETVQEYELSKVELVVLNIGRQALVEESCLHFAFKHFSSGTAVEEAKLLINYTDGAELYLEEIEGE